MRGSHPPSSWWRTWLDEQRQAGFPALTGSEGSLRLTPSDALLNALIAERLPARWPISELTLHALEGHEIAVRVRPRSVWLPPVTARVTIEQQPATPAEPRLRARFTSSLGGLAGVALGAATIPRWIQIAGDLVTVDLAALAADLDMADLLSLVRRVMLGTERGRVVLIAEMAVERQTTTDDHLDLD